ncbi:MAG: MMPL family transporter [Deltaproteobacteria bacterium]|nr:MMPL family transporter [Deltaproteobacteria bacterium]
MWSIYDLVIEDLPQTKIYRDFKKQYGSEEIILIVAKADNFFDPKTFDAVDQLAKSLSETKGVKRVISLPGIKKTMDLTDKWSLDDFEKVIAPIKLMERNIISTDRKTTVISLVLEDVDDKEGLIRDIREAMAAQSAPLDMYQIGMPIVSEALAKFTEQDFRRLPLITFALIALVLFLIFRNLRGVLIPTGTVLIALIWTFGLMAWSGIPLSMLTMIVPVFLIAVGTAYCMYIFPEYGAAAAETESRKEAAVQCFLHLGFPTSLAVITTSIGLGSLFINKIPAIRTFAGFACFGILVMLVIIMSFLPAVMSLLPLPAKNSRVSEGKTGPIDRILELAIRINLNHQKAVYLVLGAVAVFGIVGMTRLQVETNPVDFFKKDTDVSRHFHDIYKDMAGSFPVNVELSSGESDYFEDPEHLKFIAQVQAFLDTLPGVDKSISFADYLMLVNYATNKYKEELYVLPDEGFEVRMLINSYKTLLGQDMLTGFMDEDFSKTNIMLRTHLSSSKDFLAVQETIEQYLAENAPKGFEYHVTGFGMVISHSSQILAEGQGKSLLLTLVLVFGIMFLLFISWKVGLISMVPNCFPIVMNFGIMGWAGVPLSTATSLIASIAIGLAVDDTIHYLVSYNREFKKDLDKERALQATVRRVGKPILFTTLTISLGFSVLILSNFKPTSVFGVMMIITMASALVADMVLLPSLMLHVELVTVWDLLRLKLGRDPQEGIPLFQGLSRTQVHYILMAGALRRYDTGEIIMRKGETSDSMYAIISGDLDVVDVVAEEGAENGPDEGIRRLLSTLKAGEVVGEMGMIRSCERSATVIAAAPSELLQINDRMIKRLQWLYPPTAQKFFFNLMAHLCDRLQTMNQSFLQASTIDSCTGLSTRDYMMGILAKEMARSGRYRTPVSFFLVQFENYADMSRHHGHSAANFVLEETGKLINESVKDSDYVCRYDWQRFAGILTHTDSKNALEICRHIQQRISDHRFVFKSSEIRMQPRVGIAHYDGLPGLDIKGFVDNAFEALQQARKPGAEPVQRVS